MLLNYVSSSLLSQAICRCSNLKAICYNFASVSWLLRVWLQLHSMLVELLFLVLITVFENAIAAKDFFNFAIYPKDEIDDSLFKTITADLEAVIHPTCIYILESKYLRTFCWWAPMETTQAWRFGILTETR